MGGKTSEWFSKGKEFIGDTVDDVTQREWVKEKGKKVWDKTREKTGVFEKEPPPPAPPAPAARTTQGVGGTQEQQKRKGSNSTRKLKRTPLGGGASLT